MQNIPAFVAEKNRLYGDKFLLLIELNYDVSTLTTALAGANNDLTFTGRVPVSVALTLTYVVAGLNTPLSIGVVGGAITVNVATNGGGAATSTAKQVIAALKAHTVANATVDVHTAPGNDGSGVVTALASTPFSVGQYLRWAQIESGSISFEGKTWTAIGIGNPVRSQSSKGKITGFDIPLANPARSAQSVLHGYIVEDHSGRLITVHRDMLGDPLAKAEEWFTVKGATTNDVIASLVCEGVRFNPLRTKVPKTYVTRAEYPGILGSRSRYY